MLNKIVTRCWVFAVAFLLSIPCLAQDTNVTTEGMMRSNGKIYVVMAICLTILIGLIGYLVTIDRKISKLEKEN